MKYLSKISVSKQEAASNGLFDLYKWHKFLWNAFPGYPDAARDFLFRVNEREYEFIVYLLSNNMVQPPGIGSWQTKQVTESFFSYKKYRFELRANPTVRKKFEGDKQSKRIGIYNEELLRSWMTRKAALCGFSIITLDITRPNNTVFYKKDKEKNRKCTVVSVDFRGILEIIDKHKFMDAFNNGIGSGKSFGFGLLVLEPVR